MKNTSYQIGGDRISTAANINKQNCIVQFVPINRFGAAAIYPRYPAARNTPDGHGVDLIGISPTPRISRSRPHCLSLWLGGSIIVPSACHRRLCSAVQSPSPEGWCVRLYGLPVRAAEGKYPMCWLFSCQRTIENFQFCSLTTKGKSQRLNSFLVTSIFQIRKNSTFCTNSKAIFYLSLYNITHLSAVP